MADSNKKNASMKITNDPEIADGFSEGDKLEDENEEIEAEIEEKVLCDFCSKIATHSCFKCGKNGCDEHVLSVNIKIKKKKKEIKTKVLCCIECLSSVDVVDDEEEDEDEWEDEDEDEEEFDEEEDEEEEDEDDFDDDEDEEDDEWDEDDDYYDDDDDFYDDDDDDYYY
ncbi:MAG: hypothetical protein ACTSRA_03810 [Promethearchaeota archaeon]